MCPATKVKPVELATRVERIDPLTDPRWDPFIERHPLGWLSHTSAWARVLTESFRHLTPHYLGLVEGEEIRAALCLFRVESRLLGNRLVSLPLTTLCDPLVSSPEQCQVLVKEALAELADGNSRFLEVRCLKGSCFLSGCPFLVARENANHFIELDGSPPRLSRGNVRRAIRTAHDAGVTLRMAESKRDVETYYALYVGNRKRLRLPPLPYRFFERKWEILAPKQYMTLMLAEYQGAVVAGLLLLQHGDRMSGESAAWDERHKAVFPSHFLWWEAIERAAATGIRTFDFGRTPKNHRGLMDFKRRWDSETRDIPIAIHPRTYAQKLERRDGSPAFKLLNAVCGWAPISVLPLIGRFCYRHSS